jgi:hypothetical protein
MPLIPDELTSRVYPYMEFKLGLGQSICSAYGSFMRQNTLQTLFSHAQRIPRAPEINPHFHRLIARYQARGLGPDLWESEFAFQRRRRHNAWLQRCRDSGSDPRLMMGTTFEEGQSRLAELERAMAAEERVARRYFRMELAASRGEFPCYMDLCDVLRETEGKLQTYSRIVARELWNHKPVRESTQRWQTELEAQREHVLRQMAEGYPHIFGRQRAAGTLAKLSNPRSQQAALN